ncbi:hypothetical protein KI387_032705 [Taxus chinensis]|uniref:Uncharacterized protein n=1 Tax=Taxus chinensis TaxID=29808 RepID=A0AA38C2V3_TAXCH|nr:hypothetical protein KI387_032705 [Taxus chinensis]
MMSSPTTNVCSASLAMYFILILASPNFVHHLQADPQTVEAGHGCSLTDSENPPAFRENRAAVFSSLAKNISLTRFATASNGQGVNAVYGLAQCRNDLSLNDCSECHRESQNQIVTYCRDNTGARMIFDGCFLRYENYTFFDQAVDLGVSNVCSSEDSTSPRIFNNTVQKLLENINSEALKNEGFATGKMSANGLPAPLYGLAMCRRTLSTNSCDVCLQDATKYINGCPPRQDGKALEAGCYLRYSTIPFFSVKSSSSGPSKTVLILIGTLGGAGLIAILGVLFIYRRSFRKFRTKVPERTQDEDTGEEEVYFAAEEDPKGDRQFTYDALRAATQNFDPSKKIGEGGFGQVYKGTLSDGRDVAVKKLFVKQSTRAMDEFVTEIKLISAIRHRNLVRLLGCCTRGMEKLLVYEFMPNMSLDKHLFADIAKPLNWKTRLEVIVGTAHGLAYLNEESRVRIIHRDIKAANILLDNDFQPKIADFGLARLFPDDHTHLTTRVGGTIGYTAPEYATHGQLTDKADVYSYGVLVLEIVSGRKVRDPKLPPEMELLLQWGWSLHEKNEAFELVDRRIAKGESEIDKEEIVRVIHIAHLCTQSAPETRPSMSNVVSMLTSNTEILVQPTPPPFIDVSSNSDSINIGWMDSSMVASTEPPLSVSLEAR